MGTGPLFRVSHGSGQKYFHVDRSSTVFRSAHLFLFALREFFISKFTQNASYRALLLPRYVLRRAAPRARARRTS